MNRSILKLVLFALAAAAIGADCDGNIVDDPTFRDWCGDSLCSWKTESGQIQRVPTWNKDDFGVAFLDADGGTEISQITDEADAKCILFTSVGDIDPNAQMSVAVDFNSDGSIDFTAPLGTATWRQVQSEISAPAAYKGITFYVKKSGTGTAVLAEMRITVSSACTAPPPNLTGLRLGVPCSNAGQCATGLVCSEPIAGLERLCSECGSGKSCESDVICGQSSYTAPFQCGAGEGRGNRGDPCLTNSDCKANACDAISQTVGGQCL